MRHIYINAKKKLVIVDDEDYQWLNDLTGWWENTTGHVQLRKTHKGKTVNKLMSHLIMLPEPGMYVVHRNGDKLDHRRKNLEVISVSEARLRSVPKSKKVQNAKHYSIMDNGKCQVFYQRGGYRFYDYVDTVEEAIALVEEVKKDFAVALGGVDNRL